MKIVVSDFDDTFYTKKYKRNIKLIKRFVKMGNIFVIATGRNITDLKKDIEGRQIPAKFYICNDGGTIYNSEYGLLVSNSISKTSLVGIIKILNESSNVTDIKLDSEGYIIDDLKFRITTILSKPVVYEATHSLLKHIMNKYKDVKGYVTRNYLVINSIESDKAKAIIKLGQITNMKWTDIYTIGDSINDIEMNQKYISFVIGDKNKELTNVSTYKVNDFEEALGVISNL